MDLFAKEHYTHPRAFANMLQHVCQSPEAANSLYTKDIGLTSVISTDLPHIEILMVLRNTLNIICKVKFTTIWCEIP